MQLAGHDIGVCSWSLRPANAAELVEKLERLGLAHVQLALGNLLEMDEAQRNAELDTLRRAGVQVTAGMISFPGEDYTTIATIKQTGGYVPDERWQERRELTARAARLSKQLGMNLLSTHVGFVPPSSDAKYGTMVDRVGDIGKILADHGLDLIMETGQEPASELLQFINDVPARNVAVNFDPANMILYGAGDPVEAVRTLGRHIRHVHIKDAIASNQPGTNWGEEVPFGTGEVPVDDFLGSLKDVGYEGPFVIERETGSDIGDIAFAIETLRRSILGPANA
jgi:sugar phosphate isomerase/epimerase